MDRREALASLATVAGLAITPVSTREAEGAELVFIRVPGRLSHNAIACIHANWEISVKGTSLEGVRALVLDEGIDVEIVRR